MQIYVYNVAKQLIATALRKVSLAHKKGKKHAWIVVSYIFSKCSYELINYHAGGLHQQLAIMCVSQRWVRPMPTECTKEDGILKAVYINWREKIN